MPKINPRIKSIDDLLGLTDEQTRETVTPASTAPSNSTTAVSPQNTVQLIPPQKIRRFRKHPFRLYEGERLEDMIASITDNGILTPVIIRKIEPDEDGYEYEMLAGHNRQNVAILINLAVIPCIVKENLSDQEAWVYVIETNVLQRSFKEMLPSEKAAVLALRYSKMICQGRRNDIIEELKRLESPDEIKENEAGGNDCHRPKSRDILGEEYELKGRSVAYYIRVNELTPALKVRLDNGEFPLVAAVELSYLNEAGKNMVEAVLGENDYKLDPKKAVLLRSYGGRLTPELVGQIISGEKNRKPKNMAPPPLKVKHTIYSKYFAPGTKQSEFERIVDQALALYFSQVREDSEAS